jgi:hypothetical protein
MSPRRHDAAAHRIGLRKGYPRRLKGVWLSLFLLLVTAYFFFLLTPPMEARH